MNKLKINIYPIVSSLHEETRINEETKKLINELLEDTEYLFNIVDIDELYNADLSLILIQSGGSEGLFLKQLPKLKEPFYLLTYGNNNSLAASLEILSYIKDNNLNGEVLHGNVDYLKERIQTLINKKTKLGVIGQPSDWLIASNVDYNAALALHNIELVDIDIEQVVNYYNAEEPIYNNKYIYNEEEVAKALRLHNALVKIKEENYLSGLTIRCFDLLSKLNTTSCLSLALFNENGITATCEGDIPSMISMHILNKITGCPGFQANPSRINIKDKKMILAHCTLPLNMVDSYTLDSHFESGIGVAIKGELKEEVITIFKLSRNLKDYYVSTGKIIRNLKESNLCRTQIEISVDNNIEYFLNRPYGNHHIIMYGDHKEKIEEYMSKIGVRK